MALHSNRKGLKTAKNEKTVEWGDHRTDSILKKRELIGELVVIHDEASPDDVAVTR